MQRSEHKRRDSVGTSSLTREPTESSDMVASHPTSQTCGALLQSPAVTAALRRLCRPAFLVVINCLASSGHCDGKIRVWGTGGCVGVGG